MKSVQIRNYFWYVFSCIQSESRKIRSRNNPVFGPFSRSDRTENNQKKFKHQINFCKKLLRTKKKSYYSNLDIKKAIDNKTFWKTMIPLFTKGPLKGEKINLIENGKNISNDTDFCYIFDGFFL